MIERYALYLAEGETNLCMFFYFGATTRVNDIGTKYKGSGPYWVDHLKTCKDNHVFTIINETSDHNEHTEKALELSDLWDVQNNPNFLNQRVEAGVPKDRKNKIGYIENQEVRNIWNRRYDANLPKNKTSDVLGSVLDGYRIPLEDCDELYDEEARIISDIYFNQTIDMAVKKYIHQKILTQRYSQGKKTIYNIKDPKTETALIYVYKSKFKDENSTGTDRAKTFHEITGIKISEQSMYDIEKRLLKIIKETLDESGFK